MNKYISELKLYNYCGFKNLKINFSASNNLAIFYGPNGCGKSTILQAIDFLALPWEFETRSPEAKNNIYSRLTWHKNYIPGYWAYCPSPFSMEAMLTVKDEKEKYIVFENNKDTGEKGFTINQLDSERKPFVYRIDADNPLNSSKFQLLKEAKEKFLDLTENIYGLKCSLPDGNTSEVEESFFNYEINKKDYVTFFVDFIIHKGDTQVHFKSMSAGEKKIVTLLAELCNLEIQNIYSVFLIDNIEMHVYFKRHMAMIRKLQEHFPDKQIIATTHSGTIVDELESHHLYDLEKE